MFGKPLFYLATLVGESGQATEFTSPEMISVTGSDLPIESEALT